MSERYFVEPPIAADRAKLAGPEAHHLLHVMRAAPGSRVTLFDGSGWEFDAEVERASRSEVELLVLGGRQVDREAPVQLTLGVALPKGDRQKWLVEKVTELGVTRLVPLIAERSVAQPYGNALERLRRAVVEASKQCGRNRLMRIDLPGTLGEFLTDKEQAAVRIVARPGAPPLARPPDGATAVAVVGPEGGFTDDEIARAVAHGWQTAALGPRVLRVETAAIALAALLIL